MFVAWEFCSNRASVKAIRRLYHMKGWMGVAELKMSPARIAPLSNSRSLSKEPFQWVITHTHTHTTSTLGCSPIPIGPIHSQQPWPQKKGEFPL